jgi:MFS family permease
VAPCHARRDKRLASTQVGASRLRFVFRALRHRDFRLFWFGQGVSVIGTWMQTMALGWLLYRLTDSPLMLGLLTAARFGPSLLGSPIAGVLTDRFPKRRVLICTQSASLAQASVLATLTLTGQIAVWHMMALAFFQGVVDTFDMPSRHALQIELVGPADLQSAISLNSSAFNGGRMVGPALAGVIVATAGEGLCFLVNAVSYLAVLVALLLIRATSSAVVIPRSLRAEFLEGVRFAWHNLAIRWILVGVTVTSVVGLSYTTLLPVFARDVVKGGPQGYGILLAGAGVGAIVGALATAARRGRDGAGLVNAAGQGALGLGLVALGVTRTVPVAAVWMAFIGFSVSVQLSTTNGFLQQSAPAALRGRVLSIYFWLFSGLSPIGGLAAGAVAERIGATWTAVGAGAICLASALILAGKAGSIGGAGTMIAGEGT